MRTYGSLVVSSALLLAVASAGRAQAPAAGARPPAAPGIEELARLDLLPRARQSIEIGMVSSYDRTGGNDDGFSGKYSFVRKEPGGLVLADLQGPGIVYRIHTPTPTDDPIEFYFDGEAEPRIRLTVNELFDGTHAPFLAPLAGGGAGGRYSYVPLPFRRSCKIVVRAEKFQFYDINFARFPAGFDLPTYQHPPTQQFLAGLARARDLLSTPAGSDVSRALVPPGTRVKTMASRGVLAPGGRLTVFSASTPGRIAGFRLGPASALAGGHRDVLIKVYWDGATEPAIVCPVGDFFGASFGDPAIESILLGTSRATDTSYIYFPMPFERSARIELVSERTSGPSIAVRAEVNVAPQGKDADEGRFYAWWRREAPTTPGAPYTFLRTAGRGHVVGVILQAQGLEPGKTEFFEGDDSVVVDGRLVIPGTGSEDSFNGGWYDIPGRWETRRSYPFSGCLDYKKPLGRTGGYRFMLGDAYAYRKSIDYTIEHGPEGNSIPTDYTSVVFFYSLDPPPAAPPLPAAAARRVAAPKRVVFVPGWNVPLHTFSLRNATLAKQSGTFGETPARYLSFKTTGDDAVGPHHLSFVCDLPAAGRYRVGLKAVVGPDQGIVRVYANDLPAGIEANLYAAERSVRGVLPLGEHDMKAGENLLFLRLTGKDPRSTGTNLDLVEIVFERLEESGPDADSR